jgi:hypothetical protein
MCDCKVAKAAREFVGSVKYAEEYLRRLCGGEDGLTTTEYRTLETHAQLMFQPLRAAVEEESAQTDTKGESR